MWPLWNSFFKESTNTCKCDVLNLILNKKGITSYIACMKLLRTIETARSIHSINKAGKCPYIVVRDSIYIMFKSRITQIYHSVSGQNLAFILDSEQWNHIKIMLYTVIYLHIACYHHCYVYKDRQTNISKHLKFIFAIYWDCVYFVNIPVCQDLWFVSYNSIEGVSKMTGWLLLVEVVEDTAKGLHAFCLTSD